MHVFHLFAAQWIAAQLQRLVRQHAGCRVGGTQLAQLDADTDTTLIACIQKDADPKTACGGITDSFPGARSRYVGCGRSFRRRECSSERLDARHRGDRAGPVEVRERFGAASLRVRDPTDFAQCLRLVDREDNKTLEAREVRCHDHAERPREQP